MNAARQLTTFGVIAMIAMPAAGTGNAASDANAKKEAEKLLGEWALSYTTKDANSNRVLDDSERKAPNSAEQRNSATGFLQFENGGKVAMDRKLRFQGHFQIDAQEPRDQLTLAFDDKNIGTYRFLIIRITDKELVLEPGVGMFNVYRRP